MAERKPLRRLPRATTTRWNPEIVVLIDDSPRLWPYLIDTERLAAALHRQCGRGVSLRLVDGDPRRSWTDLRDRWSGSPRPPRERRWMPPAAGARVLIVGDLGFLCGSASPECRAWAAFVQEIVRARGRPVALVPLGANQTDSRVFPGLTLLRWSPDARMRPERSHGEAIGPADLPGLAELVAMVSMAWQVDPPLLRELRRMNPTAPHSAGMEGALWMHGDVEIASGARVVRNIEHHRARFRELASSLHAAQHRACREHHAHLPPGVVHFETWLLHGHAAEGSVDVEHLAEAHAFFERLAHTAAGAGDPARAALARCAEEAIQDADAAMRRSASGVFHALLVKVLNDTAASGRTPRVEGSVDPAELSRTMGGGGRRRMWLVHDLGARRLSLTSREPRRGEVSLGEPIEVDVGGVEIRRQDLAGHRTHWLRPSPHGAVVGLMDDRVVAIEVETATEVVRVASVMRPRGAGGWCLSDGMIVVESPSLGPTRARMGLLLGGRTDRLTLGPSATVVFGIDASHGVYADVTFRTRGGEVAQRFRWIEPGTFWMGSPEGEAERSSNEGPRHLVTLTHGFWLADTACTQGLWSAVMGSNPSRFKGDDRPVERVSWKDVQAFLKELSALLPGCVADLPTEAEWEYACRAGTETAFSFGQTITPEQVNYDGNYPYAGGKKGRYRRETVAVKSLPVNPWGLYEMHGNVWEWCADGMKTYTAEAVEDPRGPEDSGESAPRVVRGGSWIYDAGGARSAFRYAFAPGFAHDDLGFRFCLRSVVPAQ